jgi:hypothetical protein
VDRSQGWRTNVDPDNSPAPRAEYDPAVLRAAREDQDSFRVQSRRRNNARARAIELDGTGPANQESPAGRAEVNAQVENAPMRGINPDNGRVGPQESPLNRFDWDGARARSAVVSKGDRLAAPTEAEPPKPQAPPPVSVPVPASAGVFASPTARETLFQEFLRWQERQSIRFW